MKKALRVIVPLLLFALIVASIGWYLFVYDRDFTRDMLLGQARHQSDLGNTKLSSWFYNLAYTQSGQDKNVAIELASQYKASGNYTKAEYTLSNAIADGPTVELYTALCQTFVEQDKLLDAVNMLDMISDPALKTQLDDLRPAAPVFDPAPGFYSEYISVSMETAGTTYITCDGDYPTVSGSVYAEPISLAVGETVIKAVTVSETGLVSRLTTASYTVGGVIELVEFTDPAVESAIREILKLDEDDDIYTDQLWTIREFVYPDNGTDFSDLSMLTCLKTLSISGKTIDSLLFLSGLTELETIKMDACRFPAEDLTYLANLPFLQSLTLENCGLSTIANLSNAQNLIYLDLNNNTLRNLEPLSSISTLKELYLSHNAVTSLTALSSLSGLTVLDVSYNSVSSIAPLVTCPAIRSLNIGNNALTTLDAIENLGGLTALTADHNALTDISILSSCTGLTELNISNNQITDITALSTLTNLETFNFSYNQVTQLPQWTEGGALRTIDGSNNALESIDVLKNMEDLSYVYMDYNELKSVDAIADCFHLVLVNVYGNPIDDVSALTEHNIIVNYDPTN